jgi:hypothetical protein
MFEACGNGFLDRKLDGFLTNETMTTKTSTRACESCSYWKNLEDNHGECRRHAPQTIAFEVDDEVKFESMFPVTSADDWCGDFAKAD